MPCGSKSTAWRSRSCDLRASAMAASVSARLCRSWSRAAGGCGARANRDLRRCRPLRAAGLRFRFSVFLDPKLNFTRPSRAQRTQVLLQVSERNVISGSLVLRRRALPWPGAATFCLFARRDQSRQARRTCLLVATGERGDAKTCTLLESIPERSSACLQQPSASRSEHEFWSTQDRVIVPLKIALQRRKCTTFARCPRCA